jgi:hypothetical protein
MTTNARILIAFLFLVGFAPLCAQNQRLTWLGDEYAMRYEVIIEKEEAGEYSLFLREFTEESFVEVSLPSGKYRAQVIPYDFLNQPVPVTEWMAFEVLSGNIHEIALTGHEAAAIADMPEKIVEYANEFNLYLSAAWVFSPVSPYGAAMRLGFVSAKQRFLNPGMEMTASWRDQALLFDYDMVLQSRFIDDRTALNFRLGAGVSLASGGESRWAAGEYSTHFNAGASFLCLFSKNVFAEAGMEYSQLFTQDFAYFLRASIGIGYRF